MVTETRVWLVIVTGCGFSAALPPHDAREPDEIDGSEDAAVPVSCSSGQDLTTIALYRFEDDDPAADDIGGRDGNLHNTMQVDGPPGCGRAVAFPAGQQAYVDIVDDAAWTLPEGSIELWLYHGGAQPAGVLSRDANGSNEPGHLTLLITTEGRLALRLQDQNEMGANVTCSDGSLPRQRWVHVGINFGAAGVQLFVDRVLQQGSGTTMFTGFSATCVTDLARGLGNNQNPWVIGAEIMQSADGTGVPRASPFDEGAIDHLVIRSARVDFAAR